jgi:hypothetical protein
MVIIWFQPTINGSHSQFLYGAGTNALNATRPL